jgi:CRISPR-associated protein Cas2
MVVMVLERVPESVRGELTRWFLELHAGVFVGRCSSLVRERLWELACSRMAGGAGILVYAEASEQGYAVRYWGRTSRRVEDHEGLWLVRHLDRGGISM